MASSPTIGPEEIHAAIERLAAAMATRHAATPRLLLLGVANGGVELARRIRSRLTALAPQLPTLLGTIDISFHRDDIGRNPIPKELAPTHIPADVHGAEVVLIDDVLFSGRTLKAALDELFDHGRPSRVELAILVDRGGRRLPFAPDYLGLLVEAEPAEKVVVRLDPANPRLDSIRVQPARA